MNAATRRHLELDTRVDGDVRTTLLGVLDSTITPDGRPPAAPLAASSAARPARRSASATTRCSHA